MKRRVCAILAVAVLLAICAPQTMAATFFSSFGGGNQIWITSGGYTARSADGGTPDFVNDPGAPSPLSGGAYSFPDIAGLSSAVQLDWWSEYEILASEAPFALPGTWTFWSRVTQRTNEGIIAPLPEGDGYEGWSTGERIYSEADVLVVNGDPGDLDMANPTDADWYAADDAGDWLFQNIATLGGIKNYIWGWASDSKAADGTDVLKAKEFKLIDNKVAFRLYERESGAGNAIIDVIVWASDASYVPSEQDAMAAGVPEPMTLGLMILGGLSLLRRRRA